MLLDTHFHLDFIADPAQRLQLLAKLAQHDIDVVAQTLTPSSFVAQESSARLSLGFHPWYLEDVDRELAIFAKSVRRTRFIGEIGLDYVPKRLEHSPADLQRRVLSQLLSDVCNAAEQSAKPYILSIHAVRAASDALEILRSCGVPDANVVPIFHWFTGTSDELTQLMRIGGYISVNPRMLSAKRGRAYAKQVPVERLLLETDFPTQPVKDADVEALVSELRTALAETLSMLQELRGDDVAEHIEQNSHRLYL